MVETSKQVRVDNWGIYFLQRLQLFFSKTDYCDLTLQFEGNVQLKVHRLVMNACTEYFAFLEQTCPALEENTIMMPTDLQADVIVPIVNFMYTGMLEFHPSIFDKLYKAADTMNIAVLTKLLEAQLHKYKAKVRKEAPQSWGAAKKIQKPSMTTNDLPAPLPGKKLPIWRKRQSMPSGTHPVSATFSNTKWNSDPPEKDPLSIVDNTPKPTRFEWPDDDQPPFSVDHSFDDVSLTSKPLWTKEDDQKAAPSFEEARSLAQKARQAVSKQNSASQDVDDDFVQKEQRVNVPQQPDDSVNVSAENSAIKRKAEAKATSSPKRVKITNQDDETIISIKTSNPSELDHTKIVSEILKKYPDLVKKKKNIKLKITSTKSEPPQIKIQNVVEKLKPQPPSPVEKAPQLQLPPVKKEVKVEAPAQKEPAYNNKYNRRPHRPKADFRAASEEGPWTCMECLGRNRDGEAPEFVLYYLFRKHMTDVHNMEFNGNLCKYCGKKCVTEKSMTYHLFTKHGLRPPSNIKFPQCTSCPFIAVSTDSLEEHMKKHGKDEAQCINCKLGFLSSRDLLNHQHITRHHNRSALSILDCAYCAKKLQSPVSLFTHIRVQHYKEAKRDGMTSLDETMDVQDELDNNEPEPASKEEVTVPSDKEEIVISRIEEKKQPLVKDRVKIISNVKVSTRQEDSSDTVVTTVVEQPVPEPVAVTTTATALSNIGGSLATNLGLVDIVVLDDNQQYILQQPQGQSGNAEFILPELTGNEGILQAATAAADLNSTDELVMVLTDHDYQDEQSQGQSDNSNIVVLYSHPVEGQQGQFITSQGNILVNSQGLLEIRNGAGITTTAGQILVNDTITTTQAMESPIESIELIRKEIEGDLGEPEEEKDSIKAVLRKKEKEIRKIEQEVVAVKGSNENAQIGTESNLENGTNDLLDTTDSSIQEEPMEVDEIGPEQSEKLKPSHEEEENETVNSSVEDQGPDSVNDLTNEEEPGEDIPPDFTKDIPINPEITDASKYKVNTSSEDVILNDPNEFTADLEHEEEEEDSHETAEDEAMEVDGQKVNELTEQLEEEEEEEDVDNSEDPSITQNQAEESPNRSLQNEAADDLGHDGQENPADASHHTSPDPANQCVETNEDQSTETQEESPPVEPDLVASKETVPDQSTEVDQDSNIETNQGSCLERYQSPAIPHDQQESPAVHEQEPTAEIDQMPRVENDHGGASTESDRNTDNDHNDQNDNIQSNFDDFTDESQQSSGQKVHRDLNKEILDDWDDTDSQQSRSQEHEGQGEVPDQAAINAAENVNKLMDDWDEEDEDQSKE